MFDQNNFLYRNNGDETFTKITAGAIVNDGGRSMSGSWGDYDNDGDQDLFVANGADTESQNNSLYNNNGDGTFTKITSGIIVNDGGYSWSSSWADIDNDGDIDLFVTNMAGTSGRNNFLYANNGDGTFCKITAGHIVNDGEFSLGCSWADYDNDGDLDLFVSNDGGSNNFLYANDGNSNNWINIKCVGILSNTSAIGAKVRVKANISGTDVWQLNEISGQTGGGLGGQNSLNAEFGLGDAAVIDSLIIEWPSGIVQDTLNIAVNQFLTIEEEIESGIIDVEVEDFLPATYVLHLAYPNPFNPVSTIRYDLPHGSEVSLTVYDILGREVARLVDGYTEPGYHQAQWNGQDQFGRSVPSGIYIAQLVTPKYSKSIKMLLLK